MLDENARDTWVLFVENRERVIAAMRSGECDAVLPAAQTFLDGFAGFLLKHDLVDALRNVPDHRNRVSIPSFFFCMTLLHLPLFRMRHLADIEDVLFRSPFILRSLGFNARQIAEGFYSTIDGPRPFTAEALADFFSDVTGDELLSQQLGMLRKLRLCFPDVFQSGVYSMDCMTIAAPPGKCGLSPARFVVCVLSLHLGKIAIPVLWSFAPETGEGTGDVSLGRRLVARAREALQPGDLDLLLIDRGFIDGAWLAQQVRLGTNVIIGLKTDMAAYADLLGLAQMDNVTWERVPAPKNHHNPPPERTVALFDSIESWDACTVPLQGLVIRDRHLDGRVEWQAFVTPGKHPDGRSFYAAQRRRWDEEEQFMGLGRYWGLNDLPPMRLGVAHAITHFTLQAYLLLALFRREEQIPGHLATRPQEPFPGVELAVYCGQYFALMTGSELMEIVLDNAPAWRSNRKQWLSAMRLAERRKDSS